MHRVFGSVERMVVSKKPLRALRHFSEVSGDKNRLFYVKNKKVDWERIFEPKTYKQKAIRFGKQVFSRVGRFRHGARDIVLGIFDPTKGRDAFVEGVRGFVYKGVPLTIFSTALIHTLGYPTYKRLLDVANGNHVEVQEMERKLKQQASGVRNIHKGNLKVMLTEVKVLLTQIKELNEILLDILRCPLVKEDLVIQVGIGRRVDMIEKEVLGVLNAKGESSLVKMVSDNELLENRLCELNKIQLKLQKIERQESDRCLSGEGGWFNKVTGCSSRSEQARKSSQQLSGK